jgi:hypothetical protein
MHYPSNSFAIDKSKPTIIALHRADNMGRMIGKLKLALNYGLICVCLTDMTEGDVMRLNRMYKCQGTRG